jgi:hypothetical protein
MVAIIEPMGYAPSCRSYRKHTRCHWRPSHRSGGIQRQLSPKIKDAANNIRIATLINASRSAVPFIPRGLLRLVERGVQIDIARCIEGTTLVDVERVPI